MRTREEIILVVQSQIKAFAADLELKESRSGNEVLIHEYPWGFDRLSLPNIRFLPEHITFSFAIDRRINIIEELWQEWHDLVNIQIADPNQISTLYISPKNSHPEITREKFYDGFGFLQFRISPTLEAELSEALKIVFDKMKAKSAEFKDLKNLDRIINTHLDPPNNINEFFFVDGALMFKRIILAKLCNNQMYEQICSTYRERFSKIQEISKKPGKEYYLNYPRIFETLYGKLKNISPLTSTILI